MKKIVFLFITGMVLISCKKDIQNTKISGVVFGTTYSVIYDSKLDYEKQFDSLFFEINRSMSTYLEDSDISKLNRNEYMEIDGHFERVFDRSKEVYNLTNGAFDPTIGAVVNAWDFGPEGKIENLDSLKIDSLMGYVGLDKVRRMKSKILKHPNTYLDFNAIAKGYAVDVLADFLTVEGVEDFLVEIGGELRAKGTNKEKEGPWKVGIDQPRFDGGQSVLKAIPLKDNAMATSGTYRKFKVDKNGNRYAHIIDTKTGYPSKTNLLSVSVLAKDCMTADAYATAFKTMGIDRISAFLEQHPDFDLKVFLVFENEENEFETLSLNGFPEE